MTVGLRWEAAGAAGILFPALYANISFSPSGDKSARLALAGSYRPPLGRLAAGLDRAIMHRVAAATLRCLLRSVAEARSSALPWPGAPLRARALAGNLSRSRGCPEDVAIQRRGPDRMGGRWCGWTGQSDVMGR